MKISFGARVFVIWARVLPLFNIRLSISLNFSQGFLSRLILNASALTKQRCALDWLMIWGASWLFGGGDKRWWCESSRWAERWEGWRTSNVRYWITVLVVGKMIFDKNSIQEVDIKRNCFYFATRKVFLSNLYNNNKFLSDYFSKFLSSTCFSWDRCIKILLLSQSSHFKNVFLEKF